MEHILCYEAEYLDKCYAYDGIIKVSQEDILASLDGQYAWFGPRGDLETNNKYRQIIPYTILLYSGKVISYQRTAKSNEGRLHGLTSIGFGGHISLPDGSYSKDVLDIANTIKIASAREIEEEVGKVEVLNKRMVGIIKSSNSEVDKVHFGLVQVWEISRAPLNSAEKALENIQLNDSEQLKEKKAAMESWSQLCCCLF